MTKQNIPSILFVCTANRFRSPIAEAVFRKLLREQGIEQNWNVGSAGTWADDGLLPIPSAEWSLEHLGLDLSKHQSRCVNRELIAQYDMVLVMEKGQKEALLIDFPEMSKKLFMLTELSKGPVFDIPDPIVDPKEKFSEVAQEINHLITISFQEICQRVLTQRDTAEDIENKFC